MPQFSTRAPVANIDQQQPATEIDGIWLLAMHAADFFFLLDTDETVWCGCGASCLFCALCDENERRMAGNNLFFLKKPSNIHVVCFCCFSLGYYIRLTQTTHLFFFSSLIHNYVYKNNDLNHDCCL